jgi:hypothetical protein
MKDIKDKIAKEDLNQRRQNGKRVPSFIGLNDTLATHARHTLHESLRDTPSDLLRDGRMLL